MDLKQEGTKNNMVELRVNISIISITEDELKCYIKISNLRFDLKANSNSKYYTVYLETPPNKLTQSGQK